MLNIQSATVLNRTKYARNRTKNESTSYLLPHGALCEGSCLENPQSDTRSGAGLG